MKWWGVYTQGDGAGVTGGAAGVGKATEYFMMRIGLPNGLLTSHQLRVIGELTKKYAQQPGRHHHPTEHPAALAHDRKSGRSGGSPDRAWPLAPRARAVTSCAMSPAAPSPDSTATS